MVGLLIKDFMASRFCLSKLPLLNEQARELEFRFQGGGARVLRDRRLNSLEKVARHRRILADASAAARSWRLQSAI